MERRPLTRLLSTPQRVNSRAATSHLVDHVNASRTLCGRLIDAPTWRYHGPGEKAAICAACQNIERKRHQESAAKQ